MWRFYTNFAQNFYGILKVVMQRSEIEEKEYKKLLGRIVPIILKTGLKSTTMDSVASSLGMSKRTLYEIFGSKSEMLKECLDYIEDQNRDFITKTFDEADNVMEALVAVFKRNRDNIGAVHTDFYRDIDHLYKDRRADFERARESRHEKMLQMFRLGVKQGMFREDVDYPIQSRLMGLQMEALKRIEELFPPDIPLQRIFDSIIVSFLRSIASKKGMKVLDNLTSNL